MCLVKNLPEKFNGKNCSELKSVLLKTRGIMVISHVT